MSTATPQSCSPLTRQLGMMPGVEAATSAAAQRVCVRWTISPLAAMNAGLCTRPATRVLLELTVQGSDDQVELAAWLRVDGSRRRVDLPVTSSARVTRDPQGLCHLDLPGSIALTWRDGPGAAWPMYARTDLLTRLGLRGGTYELAQTPG